MILTPRALGAVLTVLVAAGCVSHAERVAELKSAFIGKPAGLVRACLGDPNSISLPSPGVEEIGFRWFLPPLPDPEPDFDGRGSWNRERGPWLPPVNSQDGEDLGFCEVFFTLENREIREVRAVGKTAEGLDAERRCLETAQRCVESEPRPGR